MACLIFHKWGKWEQYQVTGELFTRYSFLPGGQTQGGYVQDRQKRTCEKCGYVQIKIIEVQDAT